MQKIFNDMDFENADAKNKMQEIVNSMKSECRSLINKLYLKKYKYWEWIAGIIICGIYIPSLYFILGVIGLLGLIDAETRPKFTS